MNPQAVFSEHDFCAEDFIDGLFDAGEHRNFRGVIVAGEDAAATDFGEPGENVLLDVQIFVVGVDEDEIELFGSVLDGLNGGHAENCGLRIILKLLLDEIVGFFVVLLLARYRSGAVQIFLCELPWVDEIEMRVGEQGAEEFGGLGAVDADLGDGLDVDVKRPGDEGEVRSAMIDGAALKSLLPVHSLRIGLDVLMSMIEAGEKEGLDFWEEGRGRGCCAEGGELLGFVEEKQVLPL